MPSPDKEPAAVGGARRTARLAIAVLLALLCVLAAILFRPVRCDACRGWMSRVSATRLAPHWRAFCPGANIPGPRPTLCPACFRKLLMSVPALDEDSRGVIAGYLTDPAAASALMKAVRNAKPAVPLNRPPPPR